MPRKELNRQQSMIYANPTKNFRSSLAMRVDEPEPEVVHTDFIPENKKTENEMIFVDRPPDLVELFEGRKPSGSMYYDGVWTGQFYHHHGEDEEGEEEEEDDYLQSFEGAQTGSFRDDFSIPTINRRSMFCDDINEVHTRERKRPESHFRTYGASMVLQERYTDAIRKAWERGQSQDMLLKRVRAKLSEKIESYAAHRIRLRKKFDYFDKDKSRSLYEHEFREFLDLTNCYLDEVESLALFAYLDEDCTGNIKWKSFEKYCIVRDSSCGLALLPKAITGQM